MKRHLILSLQLIILVAILSDCRHKEIDVIIRCPDPGPPPPANASGNLDFSISNISVINEFDSRMSFNLTGILDPSSREFLEIRGSMQNDQNLWLEEDGVLRGTTVRALASNKGAVPIDLVFIVDNSGSMSEEADSIASQIDSFAKFLTSQKLNVRFACVGQDGNLNGALDLTTQDTLSQFLSRSRGTSRTLGFVGKKSDTFRSKAYTYRGGGENSITGLYFARDNFSWRSSAVRVFICFTDEPTQPDYAQVYDNSNFRNNWTSDQGTVNVVYSVGNSDWTNNIPDTSGTYNNRAQRPWELAQITGGTVKIIHSDCRDLSLLDLPVTQALSKSYIVEFCTTRLSGEHELKLTLKSKNGTAGGTRTFTKLIYK